MQKEWQGMMKTTFQKMQGSTEKLASSHTYCDNID